jgi:C4-dicarboxylate-specific signal transduction histidine kinase
MDDLLQSIGRLPEGTALFMFAAAVVAIVQAVLIGRLLYEHRRRLQAERAARSHLVALAHLDRRVAMGELATALAHEINQPLTAILHNADAAELLLESDAPALDEIRAIVADIHRDDVRAAEIIQRMRALLQKHELKKEPVDVNGFAYETVALVLPVAVSRGAQVHLELASDPGAIVGDRIHLQQVLLNLLLNAIDAVEAMPPERRRLVVRTARRDRQVEVSVEDSGAGIAADAATKIFEPFYTTKVEGMGMGMGLSIARSIVEAHGGHIAAETGAKGGARVWFTLPSSPPPTT